jgi:hypothetical protein
MKEVKLKPKKIKGRIRILKALPYEGHMVYIRLIDTDIFEWLLVFNNEVYSSYMVITPPEGKKELTKQQINVGSNLVWAGATATIDTLMGKELPQDIKEKAEILSQLN